MNLVSKKTFAYQKKIWHDQKFIVILLALFAAGFEFAFGWLLFEAKFYKLFETVANLLPSSLMNFIGISSGETFYASQLLSFGYSHPLILISLSILPISIPTRYISGEIQNRTLDLFLTKPVHRNSVPINIFLFLSTALAILSLCIFIGTFLSYLMFNLEINIYSYSQAALVSYLFFVSMGSISLLIAVSQNERGKAITRTISLFVFFYFFDTIIRLNKSLTYLTSYSYYNLFQAGKLIRGEQNLADNVFILCIIIAISFISAVVIFNQRDL